MAKKGWFNRFKPTKEQQDIIDLLREEGYNAGIIKDGEFSCLSISWFYNY